MTHDNRFSGAIGGNDYDLINLIIPHEAEVQATVATSLHERVHSKTPVLLDIGTGTGHTAQAIAITIPGSVIDSVDNERRMTDAALEHLKPFVTAGRMRLITQDALNYLHTIPDDHYDGIVSCFTIHNFTQDYRAATLQEIARVLRPGGAFVNGDKYARDDPAEQAEVLAKQLSLLKAYDDIGRPDVRKEWHTHYLLDEEPDRIWREGVAKAQLKALGFVDVKLVYRKEMEGILVARKAS